MLLVSFDFSFLLQDRCILFNFRATLRPHNKTYTIYWTPLKFGVKQIILRLRVGTEYYVIVLRLVSQRI